MKLGTLYGMGVGPGDPELVTVKAAKVLSQCSHVFVPKARIKADSVALAIAKKYIKPESCVHEVVFPMSNDKEDLQKHWDESAEKVAAVLRTGEDASFLTLGDAFLYSTYIYLVRSLRRILPDVPIETVPGVNAFSAVAALTEMPIGEGKELVTIVPTSDDLGDIQSALDAGGTVVLMKVGRRLEKILELLDKNKALERSVFVSHAGMKGKEQVVTDLRSLYGKTKEAGYLSIILVASPCAKKKE